MRKLLFLTVLCTALGIVSCSDKDKEEALGPAGSAELFYGSWDASHAIVEVKGKTMERDIEAGVSIMTFSPDGTMVENSPEGIARGTWGYDPETRILEMYDNKSKETLEWYIRPLTDQTFVVDYSTVKEGIKIRMIITYVRYSTVALDGREETEALGAPMKRIARF